MPSAGLGDGNELVGRVKARLSLEQLAAEIVENSMLLGEVAYDIEPGWLGIPVGTFSEHVESSDGQRARAEPADRDPKSDEDLLARFLAKNL